MVVCYFGLYNKEYSRNKILIKGLKKNGVEVIECHSSKTGVTKFYDLYKKHQSIKNKYDVMIVGFPGQLAVLLARCLTRKVIVFDAFLSLYDSMIFDRKLYSSHSWQAGYFWLIDWLSCLLADKILLDTSEHIKYFVKTFKLNQDKFIRVFVGSDDDLIFPVDIKNKDDNFIIHFHGTMVPLQGVSYILLAAKLLEKEFDIKFNIIGSKIKKTFSSDDYKNVNFIDTVPYEKLQNYINLADISLGVFGDSTKAQRVIPNKVYEGIACAKPVITGASEAIDELFVNNENIVTCRLADPVDLVDKILTLKKNKELRDKIGHKAFVLFKAKLTPQNVVGDLLLTIYSHGK